MNKIRSIILPLGAVASICLIAYAIINQSAPILVMAALLILGVLFVHAVSREKPAKRLSH